MGLDMGQGPKPVAVFCGALEFELSSGFLHQEIELFLHSVRLPAEQGSRVLDELRVIAGLNLPCAWRRAALDLIQQARPGEALIVLIGPGSEQKRALKRIDGTVDGARARKRAEIVALDRPRAAMLGDLRRTVTAANHDVRKGFIVAERDVVAWLEALDEIGFEKKSFRF